MMLKILQISTVAMFILMVLVGAIILFAAPEKMDAYGKLIGIIWPIFVAEVVPAFLGRPLSNFVKGVKTNLEGKVCFNQPINQKEDGVVGED